ncbi:GntR family transcriptional regulator [Nitratireductor sp. B36]|uniref:GntR family transcriptional regulator n=1 Tax=Nitratireductor sp. B36 TaxID=2762059 RepID=UPI001E441B6D|nr:GntR family transcriptional regulator [Nitratireductor sp. B36]
MAELLAGDLVKAENPELAALAARPYAPRSARPIWLQIYDRLADAIRQELVPPGSRLPGEVYLADLFGVSRITMRRALALHQNEGLLQARKGVGIFVRQRPRRFLIRNDMQFAESLLVDGGSISSKNLWLGRGRASAEAADLFEIEPGEPVIFLHRLRQLDGAPIYVSRKEFPISRFPDFEERYHESGSVRAVFRSAGIENYRRSETRVLGGFASKEEAEILEISPQTPVQYVTSINRDASGKVIEFNRGCWPMASVELVFAIND